MNHRLGYEALRNLVTGRLSTAVIIAAAVVAIASTFILETRSADSTRTDFEAFQSAGGFLFRIEPTTPDSSVAPTPLRRDQCERLNELRGVTAAGSTGTGDQVILLNASDEIVRVRGMSPGIYKILNDLGMDSNASLSDILVSESYLSRIGLASGATIGLEGVGVKTIHAAPLQTVGSGFTNTVMTSEAAIGETTTCYVALEPNSLALASSLRSAFGRSDTAIYRMLAGTELAGSPLEEHATRNTRHLWWTVAVFFAVTVRYVTWTRRSEIALYKSLGLPSSEIRLMLLLEFLAGSAIGSLAAVVAARIAAAALGYHPDAVLFGWVGATQASTALVLATAVSVLLTHTGNPLEALKDR